MYLLNYAFIQGWILAHIDLTFLAGFGIALKYILYWVLTVTFSIILYKYYEVPMTKLRDRKKQAEGVLLTAVVEVVETKSPIK